jgi:hypothetical protein
VGKQRKSEAPPVDACMSLLRKKSGGKRTYSMVMQLQMDKLAHEQSVSASGETGFDNGDRQLSEAQVVLRRKLVSLAKP